jgi:hypothetical protein
MGNVAKAADAVEKAMAKAIPVIVGFLARLIGLGGIGEKVKNVIQKIRKPIDNAIDKVVDWIVEKGKKLWGMVVKGAGAVKEKGKAVVKSIFQWWKAKRKIKDGEGNTHTLFFKGEGFNARLTIASVEQNYEDYVKDIKLPPQSDKKYTEMKSAWDTALLIAKKIDTMRIKARKGDDLVKEQIDEFTDMLTILGEVTRIFTQRTDGEMPASGTPEYVAVTADNFGTSMEIEPLTKIGPPGAEPKVTSPAWNILRKRKKGDGTYYIRGHLLNHNVHGSGTTWQNLTPITGYANTQLHEATVETHVKQAVLDGAVLYYSVEAKYDSGARASKIDPLITKINKGDFDSKLKKKSKKFKNKVIEMMEQEKTIPTKLICTARVSNIYPLVEGKKKRSPKKKYPGLPITKKEVKNEVSFAPEDYSIDD